MRDGLVRRATNEVRAEQLKTETLSFRFNWERWRLLRDGLVRRATNEVRDEQLKTAYFIVLYFYFYENLL